MFKRRGGESGKPMDEAIPRPCVQCETTAEARIVLLKPKFRHPWLVKHLLPRLRQPNFRIKLDEIGSAVWKKCDGQRNALQIAHELEQELGEKIQPVYERLGRFLAALKKEHFIEY